jgi:hypothetical protein
MGNPSLRLIGLYAVPSATVPAAAADRLQELRRYVILDTDPEEYFDALARLAGQLADTPSALIGVMGEVPGVPPPVLDELSAYHLFRRSHQAIRNACCNSACARVRVHSDCQQGQVRFSVEEDRAGLVDPEISDAGLGHSIVDSQTHKSGAELQWSTLATGALRVECTLPCVPLNAAAKPRRTGPAQELLSTRADSALRRPAVPAEIGPWVLLYSQKQPLGQGNSRRAGHLVGRRIEWPRS